VSDAGSRLTVALCGAGYLGSRHAEGLSTSSSFHLTVVHDSDRGRAETVAARVGVETADSLDDALDRADTVVVATSTTSHREVAERAIAAGKHVLVEKPLTGRVDDARALVQAAAAAKKVLHVGHVERFNPALRGLLGRIPPPRFVESHRLAPLVPRNLDIDVVQDLMVHDLDLALAFVGEEPESVEAMGIPVLTGRVDIANARLRFPGGAVANLTASRVSRDRVRKFRMFLSGTYVSADCAARRGDVFRLKKDHQAALSQALQTSEPVDMSRLLEHNVVGEGGPDALRAEHEAFARAVRGEPSEGVTGEEALGTLRTMVAVERAIEAGRQGD
jgi:predicted dehydrogenase